MLVADTAVFVNQIGGWPIALIVSTPGETFIVNGYRVGYAITFNGIGYIVKLSLISKFRIMNTDDGKIVLFILCLPFLDPRNCPLAVNSTEGPKF